MVSRGTTMANWTVSLDVSLAVQQWLSALRIGRSTMEVVDPVVACRWWSIGQLETAQRCPNLLVATTQIFHHSFLAQTWDLMFEQKWTSQQPGFKPRLLMGIPLGSIIANLIHSEPSSKPLDMETVGDQPLNSIHLCTMVSHYYSLSSTIFLKDYQLYSAIVANHCDYIINRSLVITINICSLWLSNMANHA